MVGIMAGRNARMEHRQSPVARCYEARFTDPIAQPQPRPQGQDGRSDLFTTAIGPGNIDGAAVDSSGCCGFGGSGLRVLPYLAKAELAAQTAAPLELTPVLDSVTAVAAGAHLTLPPSNGPRGQTPQQSANADSAVLDAATTPRIGMGGLGLASRVHSVAGPGLTNRYDMHGIFQLRGSGSKLMTSPSKAMKIFCGDSGVAYTGVEAVSSGVGPRTTFPQGSSAQTSSLVGDIAAGPAGGTAMASGWNGGVLNGASGLGAILPWKTSSSGLVPAAGPTRDSPPMPRSSAVPTPFRTAPGASNGSTRAPALATVSARPVSEGGSHDDGGVSISTAPRDPRLQRRVTDAEAPGERSVSAAAPRGLDGRAWTPAPQCPGSLALAAGGDLPSLPAVRVSATIVPAELPAPSQKGVVNWRDSVSGIMATPAATSAKREGQIVAATPRQLHDVTARYAQLRKRLHTASVEVMQQQQQQQPPVMKPAAWTDGATAWAMPGVWGSDAGPAATLEPAAAKQLAHNPDSSVHRQGQQVSAASRGSTVSYGYDADAGASSSFTWCVQEANPRGGDAVNGRHAEVAANQSLDGWLHASAQAKLSGYDSAIQTSVEYLGTGADAAAVARHYSAAVPPMETGTKELRKSGGGHCNSGCDGWQQTAVSPSHPECFRSQITAELSSTAPLQRPASAGSYHSHTCSQPDLPQPPQQQRSTDQRQQPPRGDPIVVHGPDGRSTARMGHDHQRGPMAEPDCRVVGRHGVRAHGFPHSMRSQQSQPHHAAQELHSPNHRFAHQQLQQRPQQQAWQQTQQLLQSQQGLQHPDRHPEQEVPAGQVAPLDRRESMVLSAVQAESIDNDDLPMDTMLLKGEVLRLQMQVANLQQQLRSLTCPECQQRRQFTSGHERAVAHMASHPEEACRLAASAITSTEAIGQQQASLHSEMQDGKHENVAVASGADSTSISRSSRAWQQLQAQLPQLTESSGKRLPSGSHNSASCAAGTDTQHTTQPRVSLSCGIGNTVPDAVGAYVAGTAPNAMLNGGCVRQPSASVDATTTTAPNAGDRAERMSVVSEASDRGSVWSMASLQSSILSYRSCLSPSTSRISVDGSGLGSGFTDSGPIQSGDPASLRGDGGEPALERKGALQIRFGGNNCSDRCTVASQSRESEHLALTQMASEMPPHVQELSCVRKRANTAPGFEVSATTPAPTAVAAAPTAEGRAVDPARAAREFWDGHELASRQPSPFLAPPPCTANRMTADFLCSKPTTPWERSAGGRRNCGRRRPRQTSSNSGSDSDQSLLASDLDEAVMEARPSTAPSWATAAKAATNRVELCQAQTASTTCYNSNLNTVSSAGWSGYAHGATAPPPSPSPHVSAGGLRAAVSIGPVVRTKYIPLDDDSDSGDSESDGLLEQKYGIRRTEL
ncbi:hypothetical protein Vretifemale_9945 [Volvox reticuliferus]|uniref:Uncharacterized protein n=1 Tax=Volvox reticuliferus TaxID=1737510 RepID=A0A8J4CFV0_9CHLO|nr:hypothetical protein Vretifemale_9945 [Volvox reticuliferus]